MKTKKLLILFCLIFTLNAYSQAPKTDETVKSEIQKLAFIVGEWEGEGWMMGRDGSRNSFTQSEHIQFKLDSTAILIEGLGKNNGQIIHNAMAIVAYNKQEKNYTFNSFLSTGHGGSFKAELKEDKFYWYPNENMRYIIYLNEKGQWYEIGEMKRQDSWFQFFEMTLDKK